MVGYVCIVYIICFQGILGFIHTCVFVYTPPCAHVIYDERGVKGDTLIEKFAELEKKEEIEMKGYEVMA